MLEGLYSTRVPLRGGGAVIADDAYIIESILQAAGEDRGGVGEHRSCRVIKDEVSAEDLNAAGRVHSQFEARRQHADRNERFTPPVGATDRIATRQSPRRTRNDQRSTL